MITALSKGMPVMTRNPNHLNLIPVNVEEIHAIASPTRRKTKEMMIVINDCLRVIPQRKFFSLWRRCKNRNKTPRFRSQYVLGEKLNIPNKGIVK